MTTPVGAFMSPRVLLMTVSLTACAAESKDSGTTEIDPRFRYLGATTVSEETLDAGVTTWTFDPTSGPACMRGDDYRASARTSPTGNTDDLLIFLQGGGACWDGFCLAVTTAPAGVPHVDALDPALPENPFSDWNVTYLPYCDGSLFIGDEDHDDDGDGTPDRFHRGLANLSGALDLSKLQFPNPTRVVFAGSSGGGFGVLLALPLVRHVYPDAELIVLADSAVGVARGDADPSFVDGLVEQWGAQELLPAGCAETDCLSSGHMTGVVAEHLYEDPSVRMGVFTSWYDLIIGDLFLKVPAATFAQSIDDETGLLHDTFGDRYKRFIIDGRMHTTLLGDASGIVGSDLGAVELPPEALNLLAEIDLGGLDTTESANGTTASAWVRALVEGNDEWIDIVDVPGDIPAE